MYIVIAGLLTILYVIFWLLPKRKAKPEKDTPIFHQSLHPDLLLIGLENLKHLWSHESVQYTAMLWEAPNKITSIQRGSLRTWVRYSDNIYKFMANPSTISIYVPRQGMLILAIHVKELVVIRIVYDSINGGIVEIPYKNGVYFTVTST